MITLQNESLQAQFSTKGAELQSLKNLLNKQEYLWSGNPDYWGKFSPVLFPIVGSLKQNTYYADGIQYTLSRHGFARDKQFEVDQISDTEISFILRQDPETLKVYPFEFILELHYQLTSNALHCTYRVKNPAKKTLYFSIGGHPAFAVPTGGQLSYDDYYLEFNKDTELLYHKIGQDLITEDTAVIPLQQKGVLPLSYSLFYDDALVFKTLKSDRISLLNTKNQNGLHFDFSGFPFFGIWAAKNADFVCLEPWCGIADGINHNQDLAQKEGIITLEENKTWERSWSVTCF